MSQTAGLMLLDPHVPRRAPTVDIVLPVFNEEDDLEASVRRLHAYLSDRFPLDWVVTVADNASTDGTWGIACRLAGELEGVRAVHLDRKGRGRALRETWTASEARVVAYMDIDLSTDLDALLPLVAPLVSGHSDVAIGSRLASAARVVRGPRREAISRSYNLLLKGVLRAGFSDAQCGFKAVRADVARRLLPLVEDDAWFFDTELLVLAEHNGLRIHEVPVDWVDDPDSRVDVVRTATDDLRGVLRVLRRTWRGEATLPAAGPVEVATPDHLVSQLVRFSSIGVVSTVLFGVLFALLRAPLGPALAVVAAMATCTVANTAANRRLTFALRGRTDRRRHLAAGMGLGLLPLALSLGSLAVVEAAGMTSLVPQLVAVTAANACGSLLRFVALRSWVFGGGRRPPLAALIRYAGVSVVATATSAIALTALLTAGVGSAGEANVLATLAGVAPSFELNRRWVWGRRGPRSVGGEVVPFVALAVTGLVLSTAAVAAVAHLAEARAVEGAARTTLLLAANLAAFGSLWVGQYVVLDRVVFRRRSRASAP
jgi:putative flippase GtrA